MKEKNTRRKRATKGNAENQLPVIATASDSLTSSDNEMLVYLHESEFWFAFDDCWHSTNKTAKASIGGTDGREQKGLNTNQANSTFTGTGEN